MGREGYLGNLVLGISLSFILPPLVSFIPLLPKSQMC